MGLHLLRRSVHIDLLLQYTELIAMPDIPRRRRQTTWTLRLDPVPSTPLSSDPSEHYRSKLSFLPVSRSIITGFFV
eukprot:6206279-Pleurochrysis_carterae.AAC.2